MLKDSILSDLGFCQTPVLPEIYKLVRNSRLVAIIATIVYELQRAVILETTDPIVSAIAAKVELGTVVHGPGHLRYFGLNIHQQDDYYTVANGDGKLRSMQNMPFTGLRRRDLDIILSSVKNKSFAYLTSTVGCLCITLSPF